MQLVFSNTPKAIKTTKLSQPLFARSKVMEQPQSVATEGKDETNSNSNALQIYCRLRPLWLEHESEDGADRTAPTADGSVETRSDSTVVLRRPGSVLEQAYQFERVFAATVAQGDVFRCTTVSLVHSVVGGQDGLLFAYGATGSGKSFTVAGTPTSPGIIPRTLDTLFAALGDRLTDHSHHSIVVPDGENFYVLKRNCSDLSAGIENTASMDYFERSVQLNAADRRRYHQSVVEWSKRTRDCVQLSAPTRPPPPPPTTTTRRHAVFVTFVEIYNNYIYDLLEQPPASVPSTIGWRRAPHQIRHDSRHTVYVCGASEFEVRDADQAMRLFLFGVHNRQTAATVLNQCSSRSHAVFTLKVVTYDDSPRNNAQQSTITDRSSDHCALSVCRLTIVDLAGVERTNRTKTSGAALVEASNINSSLLTLRNCFEAMRENQQQNRTKPIPYRHHKLTFLLKSFFELGRARIRMIVCVRPSADDYDDNVQVLAFGRKAAELTIEHKLPPPVREDETLKLDLSESAGETEHFELTLTRFRAPSNAATTTCTTNTRVGPQFGAELDHYLAHHESELTATVAALGKVMRLLDASLRPFLERQSARNSLVIGPYHHNLALTCARKVQPLYQVTAAERQSSCMFGVTTIAGTPIVRLRPTATARLHHHKYPAKCLVVAELRRDLTAWQSDSIDVAARLRGQFDLLQRYVAKLFNVPFVGGGGGGGGVSGTGSGQATPKHLDVFTRLYQQTPARYKHQPLEASVNRTTTTTTRVAALKRLFTPTDSFTTKAPPTATAGNPRLVGSRLPSRHPLVISPMIQSLTNKLVSLDPHFAAKMHTSIKWTSAAQARSVIHSGVKTVRSTVALPQSLHSFNGDLRSAVVKRQLFK